MDIKGYVLSFQIPKTRVVEDNREVKVVPLPKSWTDIKPVTFGSATATFTGIPAMPGIYRVVCLPMKMAYVGQAYDLSNRCLEHQLHLREGSHTNPRLLGAYKRFGPKAFCFQVLEVWTARYSPDCLSPAEQRWMNKHGKKSLFNIRPAGSDAWLEATGQVIANSRDKIGGRVIAGARKKSGGRPSSSSEDAGSKPAQGEDNRPPHADNRPPHADNRPLGRKTSRCATCGGGFFKQRPKGARGPKEVWQPCICDGLAKQITRGLSVGTQTGKDWRNRMPGRKRRD